MTLLLLLALVLTAAPVAAGPLDDLLEEVRSDRARLEAENREREARFRAERERQASLLDTAREELTVVEVESDRLRALFDVNQSRLAEQQDLLAERARDLGELQGVVRQIAADASAVLRESSLSAGRPERTAIIEQLATGTSLATIVELEALWNRMLEEMVAQHRIDTTVLPVIGPDGVESKREVLRVGPFAAWGGGEFLRYLPEAGRLMAPARQPPDTLRSVMRQLDVSPGVETLAVVDPTRGALITLLGQRADLRERVREGGAVGYVIIALGILGLASALLRGLQLLRLGRLMRSAQASETSANGDPMSRLAAVAATHPEDDAESLGLRLDEAILAETPQMRRGISFLAMLAGIAPLLGLLGTVTGIIETFQAITLYGTGDPRLMSSGISQALVTTVMGLLVAIPMFLIHNLLNERSNDLVTLLDERAAGLVAERAARGGTGA